jgi:hypothetical protein
MTQIEGSKVGRDEQIWFDSNGWGDEPTVEEKLWRSVLSRAVLDALGHTSLPKGSMTQKRSVQNAQEFFMEPHPSFFRVCEAACIDARLAHNTMIVAITEYRDTGAVPGIVAAKSNQGRPRKLKVAA